MAPGLLVFNIFRSAPKPPAPKRVCASRASELAQSPAARGPLSAADQALSALAERWLQTLPAVQCPQHLAQQFPRIVNRLALVWPDPVLTGRYFESLLIDHRGNRKGFPPEVAQELIALRAHYGARAPEVRHTAQLAMAPIDFS
jgi:hypothetical protein